MGEPTSDTKTPGAYARAPINIKKLSRPNPIKRRSLLSSNSGDSSRLHSTPTTTVAATAATREKEMAASFLQYCAMCEKQIMTPCNSILYCSSACRRKDSAKPLSASLASLSPERPRSIHSTPLPSVRIPTDLHDHKPDLDPTEWKPKLHNRNHSEAFRYLSQFNRSMHGSLSVTDNTNIQNDTHVVNDESVKQFPERPKAPTYTSTMSTNTTTTGSMATPSLSLATTPTTTATSSFDSMYEFNLRPLQPRQNPMYYSASAGAGKGIDLVTPHIAPPMPSGTIDVAASMPTYDHDFWGKKVLVRHQNPATQSDGLGALFGKSR